jgi:DNA-binding transcriptional ArsR family regulator
MAAYSHRRRVQGAGRPEQALLLDSLNERNGQTLRELCSRLDMARQSVSKHLAVLEAANLVTTVRRGREKLHYLNAAPINEIAERWITRYERDRVHALADLKRALEDTAVDRPSFVYTTYIKTTPERLWQALTEPAFTEAYWGITFDTDWTAGSPMSWHQRGCDDRRRRAARGRVRPVPPAVVHLAHVHARTGRRARFQRRDPSSASRSSLARRSPSTSSRSATTRSSSRSSTTGSSREASRARSSATGGRACWRTSRRSSRPARRSRTARRRRGSRASG